MPGPGLLGLGFVTNFFDALGIGSYATTTSVLKLGRIIDDVHIPGTLNIGHLLPVVLEAGLFLSVIEVQLVTLVSMIVAGGLGAWFGAGVVVRWPRRAVQRGMAIALVFTAIVITLRQLGVFPQGGDAIGLTGLALVVAVLANAFIGSLMSLGIGNYAPCMAVIYSLGMSPRVAFPIMAGSAVLMMPAAAFRFWKSGRFDRRTALGLTIGGIPGVLIAVYLVKELPVKYLLWMVVGVLVYTSAALWSSSKVDAPAAA
ncbi:MAG: sulfite exporter TauE/SafE family protein [Gemmatimonadota bacterium]|nr:sulfite exporter TauE/SafE family protein [Gemmatimonadota bacterium]